MSRPAVPDGCPCRRTATVERIRELLLGAAELSVAVAAVPEWLRYGIEEEPDVVEHEPPGPVAIPSLAEASTLKPQSVVVDES